MKKTKRVRELKDINEMFESRVCIYIFFNFTFFNLKKYLSRRNFSYINRKSF